MVASNIYIRYIRHTPAPQGDVRAVCFVCSLFYSIPLPVPLPFLATDFKFPCERLITARAQRVRSAPHARGHCDSRVADGGPHPVPVVWAPSSSPLRSRIRNSILMRGTKVLVPRFPRKCAQIRSAASCPFAIMACRKCAATVRVQCFGDENEMDALKRRKLGAPL